ncbi:MFS general substrate transporter [Macrolepiota fuliginosa MF-IS2]|uniref:MFS general substrate transporter n=1 Tax=Macrolepiota fuliginosa MF-IS2 TaxID=1400762 RepID=A0A9P6BYA4_9AGAR|nr:MFS general substrate transporter [Macrolepiota fuliginosa MF-IS2]
MTTRKPPGIISVVRLTTLFASLLVSISSGTNYVTWAPQLGSRLHINHTQLNIVGLAANVGVYSSGPIWGRIVDRKGPRVPLIAAFFLLLTGYSCIKLFFDAGLPEGVTTMATLNFGLLVLCSYMTGAGGNAGFTGSVNSTAKSFPDKARATATGFVIGGFGLSAFIFSTVAHVMYAGNTSAFLQLLAIGTALPMILGCFLVRPIPLALEMLPGIERGLGTNIDASTSTSALIDDSHTRLLESDGSDVELDDSDDASHQYTHEHPRSRSLSVASSAFVRTHGQLDGDIPNIFGAELWRSGDFWLLFTILSILSGTGLMYINNVGAMSQTLYAKNQSNYDEIEAARWQATQVSTISIMNFLGRILIGIISDTAKNTFRLPRSYCLILVSIGVFLSQVTAAHIDEISNLWSASAILGLSYGSVFSLLPQVCIEWFGLPHFSENWGYLSMAPMVAGNVFMVFFGRNLDAHESKSHSQELTTRAAEKLPAKDETPLCLEGKECYVAALHLTTAMTFACILLSVWAGWRDRRRLTQMADGVESKRRSRTHRRLSGERD